MAQIAARGPEASLSVLRGAPSVKRRDSGRAENAEIPERSTNRSLRKIGLANMKLNAGSRKRGVRHLTEPFPHFAMQSEESACCLHVDCSVGIYGRKLERDLTGPIAGGRDGMRLLNMLVLIGLEIAVYEEVRQISECRASTASR